MSDEHDSAGTPPSGEHDWDAESAASTGSASGTEPASNAERIASSKPGGAEHQQSADELGIEPTSDWEAGPSLISERLRAAKGEGNEPERSLARTGVPAGASTPAEQSATKEGSAPSRLEVGTEASGAVLTSNNPGAAPRFISPRPRALDEPVNPNADRNAELKVSFLFILAGLAAAGFPMVYFFLPDNDLAYTPLLGTCLAIALGGVGAGMVAWSKILMPHEEAVQEREPFHSEQSEREKTATVFAEGTEMTGIKRRSILKRSLVFASGFMALPLLTPILSMARWQNKEKKLAYTAWTKGARLVDVNDRPIRLGTLHEGGFITVFPEGQTDAADSATLLIRLAPGVDHPRPGRKGWSVDNHVAYSKICTHAGCPVGLYEHQTHHLLCPCHQSTFEVPDGCRPIFGPAARSLPQLPIAADGEGYLYAQSGYHEPIGPSFWTRGK